VTGSETEDMAYDRVEATEAQAHDVAMQHITAYAPFVGAAEQVEERGLAAFERIVNTRAVTKSEVSELLARDLRRQMRSLRPQTTIYPQLGSVRLAVLAHVALVIGAKALHDCRDMWNAISAGRWEDASDALLMTRWPEKAGTDSERRRVLELARMMRTGLVPLAWTH
jgi:GH24 family phage-related lysozyme (muramidase)